MEIFNKIAKIYVSPIKEKYTNYFQFPENIKLVKLKGVKNSKTH